MGYEHQIEKAASLISESANCVVFTGAGISVESGIPAFRGRGGLWQKYNPECIELSHFYRNPEQSWKMIKEIFYDFIGKAEPNDAHRGCAELENKGLVKAVITQNIDALHYRAGSGVVHEFHGTVERLICTSCGRKIRYEENMLKTMPPECPYCGSLLKPDFVFFSENIDPLVYRESLSCAENCDCMVIIGTSGEVMPACSLPVYAHRNGASIIEINPGRTSFSSTITTVHILLNAAHAVTDLVKAIDRK